MRIICPACGVNMPVPEHNPGDVLQCAGCGKRIPLDEHATAPAIKETRAGEATDSLISGSPPPPPPKRLTGPKWRWPKVAVAVGAM